MRTEYAAFPIVIYVFMYSYFLDFRYGLYIHRRTFRSFYLHIALRKDSPHISAPFSLLEQTEVIKDDCLSLPVRGDVNASMGYGVTVYDEKETGVYHISRKLAADLNINKNSSEIIFASGDSMHPTIQGGDSLLIDRSKTEVHDGRIYCVRIDGQVYAKRLQKIPPATIVVISDNPKYKSFEINLSAELDYDFEIIGEIKWWGRIAR